MPVIAVVVARGGSKRLPDKALLPVAGDVSMIRWAVRRLHASGAFDRIVVGSDSDRILEEAGRDHQIEAIHRDPRCCDESRSHAAEMIEDMVSRIRDVAPTDVLAWTHPTNPLVRPSTYAAAVREFDVVERNGSDSLVSVAAMQRHAWFDGVPLNHNPGAQRHALGSQLRPVAMQDGAIFVQRFGTVQRRPYFHGHRPFLYPMPAYESLDVDVQADLDVARAIIGANPEAWL